MGSLNDHLSITTHHDQESDGSLNCDGAIYLHVIFLAFNYLLVALTITFGVVLFIADVRLRQSRPEVPHMHTSHECWGCVDVRLVCLWM